MAVVETPIFNIALLAEHSIGKSSFLNALVGNVVAPTSIQRETANIDVYQIREDVPYANVHELVKTVETRHKTNIENRKKKNLNLLELVEPNILVPPIKILGSKINANIFDFPGLNDAIDKDNLYLQIFKQNAPIIDYVVYLVDAKKPLTNTCEIQQLKEIWSYIKDLENDGIFIDLSIVVNKFDSKDDEDFLELFEDMKGVVQSELIGDSGSEIKVYRFCSHKFFVHNLKNRVKRIRIPKFYSKELQNIFTTARVNITRDMKRSLMQNLPIECESIEIMEDLSLLDDEDGTDSPQRRRSSKEPEIGDWDSLILSLEEYNKTFLSRRTKSILGYIRRVFAALIATPTTESLYKFLSSLNRYQIDYSTNRVDVHPDSLITYICKTLYSATDNPSILAPIAGTTHRLLDVLTSFFVQIYSENEIFIDYLEKYMILSEEGKMLLEKDTYTFCLCKLLEIYDMSEWYPKIIEYIQANSMFSHRAIPNILVCPDLFTQQQKRKDVITDKCKIVAIEKCRTVSLESESFLIHQILNSSEIKQNNYDLYCVILLLSVPRIILKRAYYRNCETLDLIDKYLGMDTRSYIELVINSSESRSDTEILGESVLSSKNFLQRYPNLYQHASLCLLMELM